MDSKIIFVIICALLFVLVIYFSSHKQTTSVVSNGEYKEYVIRTILKQCARWAVAAAQDKSPIVALLHANYAAGYLWALKDIANDQEIQELSGIDVIKFKDKIIKIQEMASLRAAKLCPELMGDNDIFLSAIAGAS